MSSWPGAAVVILCALLLSPLSQGAVQVGDGSDSARLISDTISEAVAGAPGNGTALWRRGLSAEIDNTENADDAPDDVDVRAEITRVRAAGIDIGVGTNRCDSNTPSAYTGVPGANLGDAIHCRKEEEDDGSFSYSFSLRENYSFDFEELDDSREVIYTVVFYGIDANNAETCTLPEEGGASICETAELTLTVEDADESVPEIVTSNLYRGAGGSGDLFYASIEEGSLNNALVQMPDPANSGETAPVTIVARPGPNIIDGGAGGGGDTVTGLAFIGGVTVHRAGSGAPVTVRSTDPDFPFALICADVQNCDTVNIAVNSPFYLRAVEYSKIVIAVQARDRSSTTSIDLDVSTTAVVRQAGWSEPVQIEIAIASGEDDGPQFVSRISTAPSVSCHALNPSGNYEINVDEGTVLAVRLCAQDPDPTDRSLSITYSHENIGISNDAELFMFSDQGVSNQGVVLSLVDGLLPDFEQREEYLFLVTATSTSPGSQEALTSSPVRAVITVNDVDETPLIEDQELSIAETEDIIATVVVSDPGDSPPGDTENPLRFTLEPTLVSQNARGIFEVDELTGGISIAESQGLQSGEDTWVIGVTITDEDLGDPDVEDSSTASVTLIRESAMITMGTLWIAENAPGGVARIPIEIQGRLAADLTLLVTTEDDGATAGIDYTPLNNFPVLIRAGQYSAQSPAAYVEIDIVNDTVQNENNEDVSVRATVPPERSGVSFTDGGDVGVLTIAEDDAPAINFQMAEVVMDEGDSSGASTVTLQLLLSTPAPVDLTITYRVLEESTALHTVPQGSADSVDYSIEDQEEGGGAFDPEEGVGTIELGTGENEAEIEISIIGDIDIEMDETIIISLDGGEGFIVGAVGQVEVTIADDDAPVVQFVLETQSLPEGDEGSEDVLITMQLSQDAEVDIPILYEILPESTASLDSDYVLAGILGGEGSLTIPAGERSQTLRVRVLGDENESSPGETDETLILSLRESQNQAYRIGETNNYTLLIVDDDAPSVDFVEAEVEVEEGDRSDVEVYQATVRLQEPATEDIEIEYEVLAESSAAIGEDYRITGVTDRLGVVTIETGSLEAEFSISILGDLIAEGDEIVMLRLRNAIDTGAAYNPGETDELVLTIVDNDRLQASFELASSSFLEGDLTLAADQDPQERKIVTATVTVELNRTPSVPTVVVYSLLDTGNAVYAPEYCVPPPEPPEPGDDPPPEEEEEEEVVFPEDGDFCIMGLIDALLFAQSNPGLGLSLENTVGFGTLNVVAGQTTAAISIEFLADEVAELNETVMLRIETGATEESPVDVGSQGTHTLILGNDDPGSTVSERSDEINFLSQLSGTMSIGLFLDAFRPRLSEYPGGYSEFGDLGNLGAQLLYGLGREMAGSGSGDILNVFSDIRWAGPVGRGNSINIGNPASGTDSTLFWIHGGSKRADGSYPMARARFEYDGRATVFTMGLEKAIVESFTIGVSLSYLNNEIDYELSEVADGAVPTTGDFSEYGFLLGAYVILRPGKRSRFWLLFGGGLSDVNDHRRLDDPDGTQGVDFIREDADSSGFTLLAASGFEFNLVSFAERLPFELDFKSSIYSARKAISALEYSPQLTVPKDSSVLSEVRLGLRLGASLGIGLTGAHIHPYLGVDGVFNIGRFHIDDRRALDVIAGFGWQQDRLRLLAQGNKEFYRNGEDLWGVYMEARYVAVPGQGGFGFQVYGQLGEAERPLDAGSFSEARLDVLSSPFSGDPTTRQRRSGKLRIAMETSYGMRSGLWPAGVMTPFLNVQPGGKEYHHVMGLRLQADSLWQSSLEFHRMRSGAYRRDAGVAWRFLRRF